MSGGKETPRQRMIGMMYLVLTALLALNVSKDLLNAFVIINDGLNESTQTQHSKNLSLMDQFKAQMAVDARKTQPFYELALSVEASSQEMIDYVESMKRHLIAQTVGYDELTHDSMYLLRNVDKKDDYDTPTNLLIGSEPAFPKEGDFTALDLKHRLNAHRDQLSQLFDPTREAEAIEKIQSDIALNELPNAEGKLEPWEVGNFYHLPLAACITNLTKIQADIRTAESDALKSLYDNVSVNDFKFDTIAARVVPKSNYVLLGENYQAEVLLAAYSTTEQPNMMLGTRDANTESFSPGDSIPVENGLGMISTKSTKEGFHTYQGVVALKRNDGSVKHFPFESEYLVAKPSLTVAPTKMNVLYKGIVNPVKISAPGVANENITASITGVNSIKKIANGMYEVSVSKTSGMDVEVIVTATLEDGTKREMGREPFRVKRLPKPYAEIGDISTTGRYSNNELLARQGIKAMYAPDFEFQLKCSIVEFEMTTRYQGNVVGDLAKNAYFTPKMIEIIKALPSGTEVVFKNIRAKGDDDVRHDLSPIVITIK